MLSGPVFNIVKIDNAKIEGHENMTLDIEKPHPTQDPWCEGVWWFSESI